MIFFFIYCDAAESWQIGLQDPASTAAIGMLYFHNYLMTYVVFIGIFVLYMLYAACMTNSKISSKFSHSNFLEIVWTVVPTIILIFIALPSFSLLYSLDDLPASDVTLKVIGHQWYWSYEIDSSFSDIDEWASVRYNSYMLPSKTEEEFLDGLSHTRRALTTPGIGLGALRFLEVDNRVILPINTNIRLLVTSSDVLHSWAIPSFGIKIDAIPGRLSQASLVIRREGVYYGQCSEICGVNHAFMPIVVKAIKKPNFYEFVQGKQKNAAVLPTEKESLKKKTDDTDFISEFGLLLLREFSGLLFRLCLLQLQNYFFSSTSNNVHSAPSDTRVEKSEKKESLGSYLDDTDNDT